MKKKYYAIRRGKQTGIFQGDWKEIERKYIKGFSNPEFRGFVTEEEAQKYLNDFNKSKKSIHDKVPAVKKKTSLTKKETQPKSEPKPNPTKEVIIAVAGHMKMHEVNRPGYYECVVIDCETGLYRRLPDQSPIDQQSPNQAMLRGIIDALDYIHEPASITVYSKTAVGVRKLVKRNKGINGDLILMLGEKLDQTGHSINNIVDVAKTSDYLMLK